MKALIVGGSGMLGRAMVDACFEQQVNHIAYPHEALDICKPAAVEATLLRERPDVVINCSGIVRSRNQGPSADVTDGLMWRVNAVGPHFLEAACNIIEARLIQVSTNCVFDGPYWEGLPLSTERHVPSPGDGYGWSKLAGEITGAPHLTIRTSFIGLGERGLIAWLLSQPEGATVEGYAGVRWNGLSVKEVARSIVRCIERPPRESILHLHGAETTKADVVEAIVKAFDLPLQVRRIAVPQRDQRLATLYPRSFRPLVEQIEELARDYRDNSGRP